MSIHQIFTFSLPLTCTSISGVNLNNFRLFRRIYETHIYEGHLDSKERFAIKKYLLIIGKKKNMQVLSHNFIYFST